MSDTWYYAELDKPVGPLSIVELKRILHRLKDWKDRLVWHSSFNDWCKAGSVPVLTAKADLLWDDEVRGLCVRVYGDGSQSFIFLYRISGHQRFIRIGQSPEWSLETARIRAQELRSLVDQGQAILTGLAPALARSRMLISQRMSAVTGCVGLR